MTFTDLLSLALHSLLRMKLRTFLTVAGVVIAIAAFVALLSFGVGNQKYVAEQFEGLGLFRTMIVYPPANADADDSTGLAPLNDEILKRLADLPGVDQVYPFDAFEVTIITPDTEFTTRAQALPAKAAETKMYTKFIAGSPFSGDNAHEVVVTDQFLEQAGLASPDSAVGMRISISTRLASIDSGLAAVMRDEDGSVRKRLLNERLDSLPDPAYRQRVIRRELRAAMDRFMTGFMDRHITNSDSLVICGVIESTRGYRINTEPVIILADVARRLTSGGISSNPDDLITALTRGDLFREGDQSLREYPSVTLILDPRTSHAAIRDSVEAAGYRAFSFAEQYDQMRKFFIYFDLFLGIIGAIALVTASLGIINTMIMSIVERTREIGVFKALGAGDRDIGFLFLIESATIGTIGSILGIICGWIATRIASLVAQSVMRDLDIDAVEMFAIPLWLIATAFIFGLTVSILAGSFPARRAAKIDPVAALRAE